MKEKGLRRGSPKIYSDAALLELYAVMLLKQINALRLQRRGLYTHPVMLSTLKLHFCPLRLTLARRDKALTPLLGEFCEFSADWAVSNVYGFSHTLVSEDKSLFKSKGVKWQIAGAGFYL